MSINFRGIRKTPGSKAITTPINRDNESEIDFLQKTYPINSVGLQNRVLKVIDGYAIGGVVKPAPVINNESVKPEIKSEIVIKNAPGLDKPIMIAPTPNKPKMNFYKKSFSNIVTNAK